MNVTGFVYAAHSEDHNFQIATLTCFLTCVRDTSSEFFIRNES
jgi:hypothetical protein